MKKGRKGKGLERDGIYEKKINGKGKSHQVKEGKKAR